MLKIVEVSSEEHLTQKRAQENSKYDYLYICKYCNQIKMSDNGTLKTFTGILACETQEEYDNITEKEDILYIVKINETSCKLYFGNTDINVNNNTTTECSCEQYTDEEVDTAINKILA